MQCLKIKMLKLLKQKHRTQNSEFSKLKQEFDEVNRTVTEQKLQDDTINLIDNILDEDNPFKNTHTDDIWIEYGLFDNDDRQEIKNISKGIIDVNEPFVETTTIEDDFKSPIETITIEDDIDIPSDDGIAIDVPKKVKVITNPNRLRLVSNRIKKKYVRQKSKGIFKKVK